MPTKILVLDPLTLAGKELLRCDERLASIGGELDFRHTGLDDESQIAEMGSRPALVPPLNAPEDLMDVDVIVERWRQARPPAPPTPPEPATPDRIVSRRYRLLRFLRLSRTVHD